MKNDLGTFEANIRECKANNAFCRMCDWYDEDRIRNRFKRGDMVMELITESSSGRQKTLICLDHAQAFSDKISLELEKFKQK